MNDRTKVKEYKWWIGVLESSKKDRCDEGKEILKRAQQLTHQAMLELMRLVELEGVSNET